MSKEFSGLAKGMNLSQTQAQQLVDFYIAKTGEAAQAPFQAYDEMRQQWRDQVKADPSLPEMGTVRTTIGRALDAIGDPQLASEFRQAMDMTGAGDHPAFVKAFYKLASMLSEGTPVRGGGPSEHGQKANGQAGAPSAAQAMYPKLPSAAR